MRIELHHVTIVVFALAQSQFRLLAAGNVHHGDGYADDLAGFIAYWLVRGQHRFAFPSDGSRRFLHFDSTERLALQ